MYSPFKKSDGRRFSAEAAMPVAGGRLMLPELCAPIHQGRDMQTVITKQFSSSSQSIKHFSGGNLLQEENLFSTKANFFADSLCGHKNNMERKTSCYNDESHTSSRTDTLVRGANRDKLQLVTTGIRERHKSGKEHTYTTKDDNTTQSTDQFQTSAQDEFCFANEIPKEFGRIKLDNEDFMGNPKGSNTSAQFPTGPFPPGDAPIPMWGPDKMGEYVDGIFSQMPTFPAASHGPSTGNDDLRILEQQMLTMQKDLAEMERHFKESLATDRPLAKN